MDREAAVAPGQEVVHDRLGDQLLVQQHPQHLGLVEAVDVPVVAGRQRVERPVRSPAAVDQQDMDVGVDVQELCLDGHSKGAQIEHLAVDRSGDPEVLGRPATSAPLLIHCHPNPALGLARRSLPPVLTESPILFTPTVEVRTKEGHIPDAAVFPPPIHRPATIDAAPVLLTVPAS